MQTTGFFKSSLMVRYKSLMKFAIVGVLNTLVDLLTFYILYNFFSVHYAVSQVAAYSAGVLNSFVLNKLWTFDDRQVDTKTPLQLLKFVLVNLVSLCVTELGLKLLVDSLAVNVYLSKLAVILPSLAVNFLGCRLWVFRGRTA